MSPNRWHRGAGWAIKTGMPPIRFARDDRAFDVVGMGFNTMDHVCLVPRHPRLDAKDRMAGYLRQPGGQIPTALVALQRWGLRTAYVGPFGDDEGGRIQQASLVAEGVDISASRVCDGVASQVSVILVDQVTGERAVLWNRPEQLRLQGSAALRARLTSGKVLFLDADDIDTAIEAARSAREAGVVVALDVDVPTSRTGELLALADVVIVSASFPPRLTGITDLPRALARLAGMGPRFVVATLGAGGALAVAEGRPHFEPAFRVSAADTTAAGDVFHAGCLYGLLREWEDCRTLRFAAAAAALECTRLGGRAAIPSLGEVLALAT